MNKLKAVFPCKGVVVLTKKDVQSLESFYNSTLNTSKMTEIYSSTEFMVQIGNFNYLPPKAKVILEQENLLTITKLRSVMNGSSTIKTSEKTQNVSNDISDDNNINDTLSDDDILSHPFFTTLKPID